MSVHRLDAARRRELLAHLERFDLDGSEIAVVGLAGRFPGAADVETFWSNLCDGVESIRRFSTDELMAAGAPVELVGDPSWVPAVASFDDFDRFDAPFFGFSHREAEIMDPQHRVALECAWKALEDAGQAPSACRVPVGVFMGATINTYLLLHLSPNRELMGSLEPVQINLASGADFLATRIAYKLSLEGPAFTVQSACSTSLVAVHAACQSLHAEECDMALAGGVSVNVSHRFGYRHVAGSVASPDGRCRPFGAAADGTVFGAGVGAVVLKRLDDAMADGDTVRAVIRGSAINNDGSAKVGYTAPSVEGQAKAISEALADAGVDAETLGYVEAHGTATPLGDPVEVEALCQAFAGSSDARGFCVLGSVKGNVGHLDAAAGVTGLIKGVLAVERGEIPPSLHCTPANPEIDFDSSPFYVAVDRAAWPSRPDRPRRAGVSAFGVGGTNAHVVLQEPPPAWGAPEADRESPQLLVVSAATEEALARSARALGEWLGRRSDVPLRDVAHTLAAGRAALEHRAFVVAHDPARAAAVLLGGQEGGMPSSRIERSDRPVAFLLPGQGAQRSGATAGLYEHDPVFRRELDHCAEIARAHVGVDLRDLLHGEDERLHQTRYAQPALLAVEHALARWWASWGVEPVALLGHSVGEYTAACLAGVFSLEDALALLAVRGRLIQELPPGSMLSIPMPEEEVGGHLDDGLSVAAVNGPDRVVVSGSADAVGALRRRLSEAGVAARELRTSHAFHSPMMEPVADRLAEAVGGIELSEPRVPFLSNVTGGWIEAGEATDPAYWVRHLLSPVRFSDAVSELARASDRLLVEVGPGRTLSQIVRRHPVGSSAEVVATLPAGGADEALDAVGRVWVAGVGIDWSADGRAEGARRVPLPTYPFDRHRYWIEPPADGRRERPRDRRPREEWLYLPTWRATEALSVADPDDLPARCLVLLGTGGLGDGLVEALEAAGVAVSVVRAGDDWRAADGVFEVRPGRDEDWAALAAELGRRGRQPEAIVHLWSLGESPGEDGNPTPESFARAQERGLLPILRLLRALQGRERRPLPRVLVAAEGAVAVTEAERLHPEKATLEALGLVLPQEGAPGCRLVDMILPPAGSAAEGALAGSLLAELAQSAGPPVVALRGRQRWLRDYEPAPRPAGAEVGTALPDGPIVVSGGLRGIGFALAGVLARRPGARLAILDRVQEEERRRAVTALEDLGAEVLTLDAGPEDRERFAAAAAAARDRFGPIAGVVHAWGNDLQRSFAATAEIGADGAVERLAPKVHALLDLERALAPDRPTLHVVSSSLSTVLGGVGAVAYAAANLFLDRFGELRRREPGEHWLVLDWDAWRFDDAGPQITDFSDELARAALEPEQGAELFLRALAAPPGRYVVSTLDLVERVERSRSASTKARESSLAQGAAETAERGRHPRPRLATPFVAPSPGLEQAVAEIWCEALGVESVGVEDNFFELGGDSLIAIQAIDRLKRHLGCEISTASLYEGLTVRSLITLIEAESDQAPAVAADPSARHRRAEQRHDLRKARRRERRGQRVSVPSGKELP